jgi:dipeptidyl aminopeptidase/acylaminoacyl peptidase
VKCPDLYQFRRIVDAALSPRGNTLAYVVRFANADNDCYENELYIIHLVPEEGSALASVRLGVDLCGPAWSREGHSLAAIAQSSEDADDRIVLYSSDGELYRSFDVGQGHITDLAWSSDGAQMAFLAPTPAWVDGTEPTANCKQPRSDIGLEGRVDGLPSTKRWQQHLYLLEVSTGVVRQVTRGSIWVNGYAFSPHAGLLAYCARALQGSVPGQPGTIQPSALWLIDLQTGCSPHQLAPYERSARSPVFTANGTHVVFTGLSALTVGPLQLFTVPVTGEQIRRVAASLDRSIALGSANHQGGGNPIASSDTMVFCARDDGSVQLYEASVGDGDDCRRVAGSATESVSAISSDQGGSALAFVVTTLDGSQQLRVESREGTSIVAACVEAPPPVAVARPWTVIAWDGLQLHGWLIRRDDAPPGPLLVDVHGGSFSGAWAPQVDPSRLYQQELAEVGWTILLLNQRGSDGYGEEFAGKVAGRWGEADARDLLDAIDRLAGEQLVDPDRVAVTGYSYGGFMANWLTSTTDRFSAAVSGGSICDFVTLFGTSDMGWSMCTYDIGVRPADDAIDAFVRSPLARARQVCAPTLLLHGESDQRCPISQAEEWFAALHVRGIPTELVRYPDATHGFLTDGPPSYVVDYGERLVNWVRRYTERAGQQLLEQTTGEA